MGILFNRGNSDDGCTGHHFGKYEKDWNRAKLMRRDSVWNSNKTERIKVFIVHVPRYATCQHDGCTASSHHGHASYKIPISAVLSGNRDEIEAVDDMFTVLKKRTDDDYDPLPVLEKHFNIGEDSNGSNDENKDVTDVINDAHDSIDS